MIICSLFVVGGGTDTDDGDSLNGIFEASGLACGVLGHVGFFWSVSSAGTVAIACSWTWTAEDATYLYFWVGRYPPSDSGIADIILHRLSELICQILD